MNTEKKLSYNFFRNATAVVVLILILHGSTMITISESECVHTDTTIVSIIPSNQNVKINETFNISVFVEPIVPIIGVAFDYLHFDPDLVHANSVTEGDLFGQCFIFDNGTIDNTAGVITDVYGLVLVEDNVTEPGCFVNISFTAQQEIGISPLDLEGVDVSDINAQPVPITVNNGSVTVRGDENNPPYAPSDPDPDDGATNVSISVSLSWTGGDPDPGDNVTYDVYFGTSSMPPKVVSNQSGTTHDISYPLDYSTKYYWNIVSWDNHNASAEGAIWNFTTILDVTPPVTNCTLDGEMENGWYVSDVTVTLSATDDLSGINYTKYKLDEEWEIYVDPFDVSDDGMHVLSFYSVDYAGNVEDIKSVDFKIDQTPPVTICTLDGEREGNVYISNVTVTLNATDDMSGVNYTMHKLDDGGWRMVPYNDSFIVSEEGDHIVRYYSVDNVGNVEDEKNCTFTVEHSSPDIKITSIGSGFGVKADVKNIGSADAVGVEWRIVLDGGFILYGRETNDTIDRLSVGEEVTVHSDLIIGLGKTMITVTADDAEESSDAIVILFFVFLY